MTNFTIPLRNLRNKSIIASLSFHVLCLSLLLVLGQHSLMNFKSNIIKVLETDVVDIEIWEQKIIPPIQDTSPITPKKIEPPLPSEKDLTSDAKTTPPKKAFTVPKKNKAKQKKELSKYEQILSKHFAVQITRLSKALVKNNQIYIWVKVDHHGHIKDYGFQPEDLGRELTDQLETIVALSNPVPAPPHSLRNHSLKQYLIPIKFR